MTRIYGHTRVVRETGTAATGDVKCKPAATTAIKAGSGEGVTEGKPMNRIEHSGKSQGKGRNGYFQLHSVEVMNMPTDPDGEVLHVDFYPRRRINCVGPARLLLRLEDATKLAQFLGEAIETKPTVANIEDGELLCASAGIEVRRVSKNPGTKFLTSWSKLSATRS
jgi:hypothetical protein